MDSAPDSGPQQTLPERRTPKTIPHVKLLETPLTRPLDPSKLKGSLFYAFIIRITLFSLLIIFGLLGWDYYDRTHKAEPIYYAPTLDHYEKMTEVGNLDFLTPAEREKEVLTALDQPNLSTDVLLHWAEEAATTAYTFDFYNYKQVMQTVRSYFTDAGYDGFLAALKASRTIEDVVSKKLVVSCVITGNPILLNEGATPDGTYAWQVQFPLLITYQSASEQAKQQMILTLLIARVPTLESPKGVGIASFVIRRLGGG
jgi:intracellular multiplication protein IcmL